jgi:hypothetical protein
MDAWMDDYEYGLTSLGHTLLIISLLYYCCIVIHHRSETSDVVFHNHFPGHWDHPAILPQLTEAFRVMPDFKATG